MALDVFKEDPEFRKHEEEYQVGVGWLGAGWAVEPGQRGARWCWWGAGVGSRLDHQAHRAWPGLGRCWPVWAASTCSGWPGAHAEVWGHVATSRRADPSNKHACVCSPAQAIKREILGEESEEEGSDEERGSGEEGSSSEEESEDEEETGACGMQGGGGDAVGQWGRWKEGSSRQQHVLMPPACTRCLPALQRSSSASRTKPRPTWST